MIKLTLNYENVARENRKPLRVPLLSRPRSLARSIIPSRLMMLMCVLCSSLLPKTKNDDDVSEWGTTMVSIPERMGSHGTEHTPEGDGIVGKRKTMAPLLCYSYLLWVSAGNSRPTVDVSLDHLTQTTKFLGKLSTDCWLFCSFHLPSVNL